MQLLHGKTGQGIRDCGDTREDGAEPGGFYKIRKKRGCRYADSVRHGIMSTGSVNLLPDAISVNGDDRMG